MELAISRGPTLKRTRMRTAMPVLDVSAPLLSLLNRPAQGRRVQRRPHYVGAVSYGEQRHNNVDTALRSSRTEAIDALFILNLP